MSEFQELKKIEESSPSADISWVNEITYKERKVNVLEGTIETKKGRNQFTFITDIKVTKKNAKCLSVRAEAVGKSRMKVLTGKNIRYYIEHANSRNYNAMKNHYLLTQITDNLMQLYENSSKLLKGIKKTAKIISLDLLEMIRTRLLTDEDIKKLAKPIQVRFT